MSTTDNIINLRSINGPEVDAELLDMLEELLARVRNGFVMGLAIVEHQRGDAVVIQVSAASNYHYVNSGAARLAHFLAGMSHTA